MNFANGGYKPLELRISLALGAIMKKPTALIKFKIETYFHYTCYTLASFGMKEFSEKISNIEGMNPDGVFVIRNRDRDSNVINNWIFPNEKS